MQVDVSFNLHSFRALNTTFQSQTFAYIVFGELCSNIRSYIFLIEERRVRLCSNALDFENHQMTLNYACWSNPEDSAIQPIIVHKKKLFSYVQNSS